ncbi:hypothetical protein A2911_01400 [Candidatus Nomurabacteria bacterium RIFCSPLOWO2_01_FULL_40_15]|uniref:Transcriptional repressor PaaX-like central Cas2-like domain-containing protein n=1 Tax=Candidatus Nomurabacteria bacterium RIFCSPLOWO2_01_FULL_40_15 TaxID=1801772 RepID=A0A1F6X5V2_9BACT|nr:MAG: hypothetical protein A2911_01400 [Candidatus Nomurabacteria bacterium RIFCSPLOWO2_01_FULL_40_15]
MSRKRQKVPYSNKILRILDKKLAVSLPELHNLEAEFPSEKYAITRSLKRLQEAGLVEKISSSHNDYARLTKAGKKKIHSLQLNNETTLVNTIWDGLWRIIILDLGEDRKNERESLRYLLKKANFVCIKNTVWISPYPFEHLFTNIKKDLNLTTELMIIVTDQLDPETNLAFLKATQEN